MRLSVTSPPLLPTKEISDNLAFVRIIQTTHKGIGGSLSEIVLNNNGLREYSLEHSGAPCTDPNEGVRTGTSSSMKNITPPPQYG